MKYIREHVPIKEVVQILGLHVKGRRIRCWRPGHRNHDANPSIGIDVRRNKVKCFVCDSKQLSPIDLVTLRLGLTPVEATEWIADRFTVPVIGQAKAAAGNV